MLAKKLPVSETPDDIKKRNEMFRAIDNNGNGLLSLAEVDKGIKDVLKCDILFDCKPVNKFSLK